MQIQTSSKIHSENPQVILVLGGTGKTGRRLIERLQALHLPVRIGSRNGAIPFDWNDRTTWEPCLQNVSALYIAYVPDLAVPGAPDDIQTLTELAVSNGVQKLVLLSGRGEEEAQRCEQIVQDCGIPWTILRCSWFNQNFSEGPFRELVLSGTVAIPAGQITEPFIDADDIADVAAAALTESKHSGQLYELTGPRLLTFTEAVEALAASTGKTIHYQEISQEEFSAGLKANGVPSDYIALLSYLFHTVLDGRNSSLCDGVQRALGREPRDFSLFAKVAKEAGQWNA